MNNYGLDCNSGCGGIGSNLFQKIARYAPLNYHICLVDGDIVEERNIVRQCFTKADVGRNKAECLAHKANNQLINRFSYHPYYLDTSGEGSIHLLGVLGLLEFPEYSGRVDNLIIFGCVDNHPARRRLENYLQSSNARIKFS